MGTDYSIDITNSGLTDVETDTSLTGNYPIPMGVLQLTQNNNPIIGTPTQGMNLRQLADSVKQSSPTNVDAMLSLLQFNGFYTVSGGLQFADGTLGILVKVLTNTPQSGVHKVEWQVRETTIDQTTGQIIVNYPEMQQVFVGDEELYSTAYNKALELINQRQA